MTKQSKSFEEVVKNVLVELKDAKPVTEAMGAGSYMPAGLGAVTQDAAKGRSAEPPFSAFTDLQARAFGGGDAATAQDKSETESPRRAPYPLEVVNDHLADAYLSLKNIELEVKNALNNPVLTPGQKTELGKTQNFLKTILGNVKKVALNLQKINLD